LELVQVVLVEQVLPLMPMAILDLPVEAPLLAPSLLRLAVEVDLAEQPLEELPDQQFWHQMQEVQRPQMEELVELDLQFQHTRPQCVEEPVVVLVVESAVAMPSLQAEQAVALAS